jgi:hypothetical protein
MAPVGVDPWVDGKSVVESTPAHQEKAPWLLFRGTAVQPGVMPTPPPPFARTTPLSEQHEVLVLQLLELLNLAVLFSGCL